MSEPRWIQTALLLTTLLKLTGGNRTVSMLVREGDKVTLPCEDLNPSQQNCDSAMWIFRSLTNTETVELVKHGQTVENTRFKSDRLSVTENCSLVLKKVIYADAGHYICQQSTSEVSQAQGTVVDVSVVYMTEVSKSNGVTLRCAVSSVERCKHRVQWFYQGKGVNKDPEGPSVLSFHCYAFVTFEPDHFMYKSRYTSLQCEVMDRDTGSVKLFLFRLPSDKEATTPPNTSTAVETSPITTTATKEPEGTTERDIRAAQWRFIIVSAGLSALIISVVVVNIWARTQGG
ncbi:uncharacterized protein LOC121521769 isoform X2 [Cheilinus undulatus]|uniref:uncharacterized protein LOC121521769 isoform X2 n=1 Tax=Cheilinus undulatus TaxID=241271 RepID=UPI001BD35831|nr:uncharacterized protein LOC121521769 isoform X2 [Cheilinus undulatus]